MRLIRFNGATNMSLIRYRAGNVLSWFALLAATGIILSITILG